ncbi:MAG: hypothetical protein J6S67_17260 [Methanobrevibacter sp.]|nr:hypothetical protein [Methanobrevibacter sp.]
MSEEKELSTEAYMTVYTGGEEWEKAKEEVTKAYVESINLPISDTEKLNALPYSLFFRVTVSTIIAHTFYHEYEDFLKGKKTFPPDTDYTLENLINGLTDLKQIKSLGLAFKARIKWDNEFAMIWFKDFLLLGYSPID